MDIQRMLSSVKTIQGALQTLALLQLTSYRFPQQATVQDGAIFDFIVVGAGSGGSVIANRLTENPNIKVLLIEAGDDPPVDSVVPGLMAFLPNSTVDWKYTTKRDDYASGCHVNKVELATRGKMLGGTSGLNYMGYLRGDPEDFNSWARTTNDESWSYENVLPYFIKSERLEDEEILNSEFGIFHGTNGYLGVTKHRTAEAVPYLEAYEEVGHKIVLDTNGNVTLGYSEALFTKSEGVRQSAAQAFLSPIKQRNNLQILKKSLVTKILFDSNNNAIGVQLSNENDDVFKVLANIEVILSAGAINSPQLLMLSGIGPKKHLNHFNIPVVSNLPVGENLQDHRSVVMMYVMNNIINNITKPTNPSDIPIPLFAGFVSLDDGLQPDYQTMDFIVNSEVGLQFCAFNFGLGDVCQQLFDKSKGKEIFFSLLASMHAKSRGKVQLKSQDPKQEPLIDLKSFSKNDDLENAVKYVRNYVKIEDSTFFKSANAELFAPKCLDSLKVGSDEYWRKYILCMSTNIFHYVGTCAMGSVVDSRLRVYGVDRLRVVDASIMPTITRANPNVPVYMIAEKAADMIKEDNGL